MVELRKRKTPPPAAAPAAKKERKASAKSAASKAKAPPTEKAEEKVEHLKEPEAPAPAADEPAAHPEPPATKANGAKKGGAAKGAAAKKEPSTASGPPKVGDIVSLDGFGGEISTNDGNKTTLKALVDESKAGVIIFTYPKASTPGCTTQACLFRDAYTPLTSTGLSVYGLSTDTPAANTTFKTKQKLPYTLLCDPSASLIAAIGFKKAPKGTTRGVFVMGKDGKVLACEPGGPAPTVEAVKTLVETMGGKEGEKMAEVADEVADTAEKLDK
ncbi:thioredoxin peroxidase dot5 [Cryomyces antarcticus]|uniref:thioredoxin-dependent peroxiredoxin n=1 Tax=Cryomyces antarcticus TaxID=329879 RepID=A0ABR0KSR3_9PEZI|nr:thioredoxin peroxidase dot5 [Cryomyces antarcticus]KAK5126201.1 thioredoxin peroxidase dot5 [Cryomyces antarcticus]